MRGCGGDAGEIGGRDQVSRGILADHPHAFRKLVERRQHVLRELIEQFMEITEQRTVGLPVIVLVVRVQHERVRNLTLQGLDDGTFGFVFACQLMRNRLYVGRADGFLACAHVVRSCVRQRCRRFS